MFGADTTVINSGQIITAGEESYGIQSGEVNSRIINSGRITTTGLDSTAVFLEGAGAAVVNSGQIITAGSGANGIIAVEVNANIINSGTISVTGLSSSGVQMRGAGTLINSGLVSATGAGNDVYAVDFGDAAVDSDQTLELQPGSRIAGRVRFGGGSDTLRFGGSGPIGNLSLKLADQPEIFDAGGRLAVLGDGGVAVVDTESQSSRGAALADLSGQVVSVISHRLDGAAPVTASSGSRQVASVADYQPDDDSGPVASAWIKGFGGWGQRKRAKATHESVHAFGGVALGADRPFGSGLLGGFYIGALTGNQNVGNGLETVDMKGGFAGVYGRMEMDRLLFDVNLTGVLNRLERKRKIVSGADKQTAKADYDSLVLSTAFGLGRQFDLDGWFGFDEGHTLTPMVRIRYAGAFDEGYQESGSSADLTVKGSSVHVVEGRLEANLRGDIPSDIGEGFVRASLGGLVRTSFGGENFSGSVLGQDFNYKLSETDRTEWGGTASLDLRISLTDRVSLFGSFGSVILGDANYAFNGEAGLRIKL